MTEHEFIVSFGLIMGNLSPGLQLPGEKVSTAPEMGVFHQHGLAHSNLDTRDLEDCF